MNFKFQISNFKFLIASLVLFLFPKPAFAEVELSGVYAFGSVRSLGELISYLVPIAFTIAGLMLTFYFLTACFNYINSHGDKNEVNAARQQIEHSIIGLILIIAAFIVVRYLPTALGLSGMPALFAP